MKKYLMLILGMLILNISVVSSIASANDTLKVKIGVYENQPKIFTDGNGNATGFWPEIIDAIALEEGWEVEYVHGTWAECLDRLANNEIDIMPDVAYTEERSRLYAFSIEPVYVSWSGIVTREDAGIESIPDLEGASIAILHGSVNIEGPEGLKKLADDFGVTCTFIETDSYESVFGLVASGDADAGVASKDFINRHLAEFDLVKTSMVFSPVNLHFAFPRDAALTPYLMERIDSWIAGMKHDSGSVYYLALDTWLGVQTAKQEVIPRWIFWVLGAVLGFILLLGAGSVLLKFQVKARTRELEEDIAEREKMEQALRDHEQKYRLLAENARDVIYRLQLFPELKYEYISPSSVNLGGYTPEEYYVNPGVGFSIVHPDDQSLLQELMTKPGQFNLEPVVLRCLDKDGTVIWTEQQVSPVFDDSGRIIAVEGIARDITKRKEAEERLQASEERYRLLAENARDVIYRVQLRPERKFEYISPSITTLTGYTPEEHYKNPDIGLEMTSKDALTSSQVEWDYAEQHLAEPITARWITKDGNVIWTERVNTPVYDENGTLIAMIGIIRDITNRKEAEDRLMASEMRFRSTLDSMMEGCQIIGFDWKYLYVNDAVAQQSHSTRERLLGHTYMELFPEEANRDMWDVLRDCMENRVNRFLENCFTYPDGSQGCFVLSISPVPEGLFILSLDVTERREAEERLLRSEENLRKEKDFADSIINTAQAIILVLDTEGRVVQINPYMEEVSGYTLEEVRGKNWFDVFLPPHDTTGMKKLFKKALTGDQTRGNINPIVTKNGEQRFIEWFDKTMHDADGNTFGLLSIGRDITEQRQAVQALEESETRFRNLFQNSLEAIIEGSPDGRIYTVNPAAEKMLGRSEEELVKLGRQNIIFDLDPNLKAALETRERTGEFIGELTMIRADGSRFPGLVTSRIFTAADGQRRTVNLITDITEQKQAEEKIQRLSRLLNSMRNVNELIVREKDPHAMVEKACRFITETQVFNCAIVILTDIADKPVFASGAGLGEKKKEVLDSLMSGDLPPCCNKACLGTYSHRDSEASSMCRDCPVGTVLPSHGGMCIRLRHEEMYFGYLIMIEEHSDIPIDEEQGLLEEMAGDIAFGLHSIHQEQYLLESEEKFSKAFQSSPDIMVIVDEHGEYLEVNDIFTTRTGYSREEVIGRKISEFNIWVDEEEHRRIMDEFRKTGRLVDRECRFRTKAGEARDMLFSLENVNLGGKTLRLSVSRDITRKKREEQELRISNAAFRSIHEAVVVTDSESTIIRWNDISEEIFGVAAADAIGKKIQDTINIIEKYPGHIDDLHKTTVNKGYNHEEQRYRTPKGDVWLDVTVHAIDDEGQRYGYVMLAMDITERKRSESLLQNISEHSPIGIYILQNGKFRYVSPQFTGYLGYSVDELIGRDSMTFVYPADRDSIRLKAIAMLKGGSMIPYEYRVVTKSGETRWLLETVTGIDYEGRQAVLGSSMNITDIKKLAEKVTEYEELNKMKTNLLSTVSHELRTPLASIKGYSTLLLEYEKKLEHGRKRESLQAIDRGADRLAELIDRLLDVSRLDAGLLKLNIGPANLRHVIKAAVKEARLRNPDHVFLEQVGKLPRTLNMDERRIRQVVDNLLENAAKYSRAGTPVTIEAHKKDNEVIVAVKDSGTGIPKAEHKKIFDRMYRLEQRMAKDPGGLGLGLSLCKSLVEAHAGRIWVESKVGAGSTFYFTLPLVIPR